MWMFSVVALHKEYSFTFRKVEKYPVCECFKGSDF